MSTKEQPKLSYHQQRVFNALVPNKDVSIEDLYYVAYPVRFGAGPSVRDMQQSLGPIISRINDKLKRGRIVPGELKQTYRLDTKLKV